MINLTFFLLIGIFYNSSISFGNSSGLSMQGHSPILLQYSTARSIICFNSSLVATYGYQYAVIPLAVVPHLSQLHLFFL